MTKLRRLANDEGGWVLVTAILLLAIMLGTILSVATYVDSQTKLGATSRKRETAFNMAQAAMNMQTYALSRDWPGVGQQATPYPACGPSSALTRCPTPTEMSNLIASADASGATWQTQVHDNGGNSNSANFYSDATVLSQPAYDANGDGRLWVRATATAKGKSRTIVELVRVEEEALDLPHAAVVAGRFASTNSGNKIVVDTSSGTGANGFVGVRCTVTNNEATACLDMPLGTSPTQTQAKWDALVQQQISPYAGHVQTGYVTNNAMSQFTRDQLKARAIADGKYFTSCPATWPTGTIVYIESGNCTYSSNVTVNSQAQPGLLLMNNGTLTLKGTGDYWGVIYCVNAQNSSGVVLSLQGSGTLHGGVFVDGNGIVAAGGTSNTNIQYNDSALSAVKGYGAAGLIQNTWREIKGS
jgi:Tfp pilus assembly protein PilX